MKTFGLFGEKLSHSLSPTIHNMLYEALDIDAAYNLFEIKAHMLQDAVKGVKALNINGVNVTIPYKVKVMDYLDSISDEAMRIGAVNTICNHNDYLSGFNTDYIGFGRMLKKHLIETNNKKAIILGTGGAAKSVITYLKDNGVSNISIASRNPEKVDSFDTMIYEVINYDKLTRINNIDLLVNCTPCGMYPNIQCSPIDEDIVSHFGVIVDLIYNPSETLLMKYAERNKITAVNGLYMLVAQAAAAVEIWIGQSIDNSIVEDVYQRLTHKFD